GDDLLREKNILLDKARADQDMAQEAKLLKEIGLINLSKTKDYEQSMDSFIKCLVIEDSLRLTKEQVLTFLAIAELFKEVGAFYKSEQFLEQALQTNDHFDDANIRVKRLNEFGEIHAAMGRYDESAANYKKVLDFKDQIRPQVVAEAWFNL